MVCRRGRIHWIWLKNLPSIVHKSDVLDDAIFFLEGLENVRLKRRRLLKLDCQFFKLRVTRHCARQLACPLQ